VLGVSCSRDQGPTDAVIDMHAFAVHNNAKESDRTLEDTDVHHLLERSMYQPRRRVRKYAGSYVVGATLTKFYAWGRYIEFWIKA